MLMLLLLACSDEPVAEPTPVEVILPLSLSRDPVPSDAIDVAISPEGVFVDHVESDDLKVARGKPVALRIDSQVPYETLYMVVERLGNRPLTLVVQGSSGPAGIALSGPDLLVTEVSLAVLISPDVLIARTAGSPAVFEHNDHAGLRAWLAILHQDQPGYDRATLVPHRQATADELVAVADAVRSAGFSRIVLGAAF